MYRKPFNLIVYGIALLLLWIGAVLRTNITVFIAIICFLIWDVGYFKLKDTFYQRTCDNLLTQIQNQRHHLSYFLPFYGVLFGILFTINIDQQARFLNLCNDAGIPMFMLVIPFVLASIPILFVPTQLLSKNDEGVSGSLKALFVLGSLFQKISIFIFVHTVLRLLLALKLSI